MVRRHAIIIGGGASGGRAPEPRVATASPPAVPIDAPKERAWAMAIIDGSQHGSVDTALEGENPPHSRHATNGLLCQLG